MILAYPADILAEGAFHQSHKAHRKRQLNVVVAPLIPFDEILKVKWHFTQLQIATATQFLRHVGRYIL